MIFSPSIKQKLNLNLYFKDLRGASNPSRTWSNFWCLFSFGKVDWGTHTHLSPSCSFYLDLSHLLFFGGFYPAQNKVGSISGYTRFSSMLCPYLCQEGLAPAVAAVLGRSCVCHSGRAEQAAASWASSMKWHNTKQPLPNFSLLILPHQRGVREELRSALTNFFG